MAINTGLLAEFKHETENSRKICACSDGKIFVETT